MSLDLHYQIHYHHHHHHRRRRRLPTLDRTFVLDEPDCRRPRAVLLLPIMAMAVMERRQSPTCLDSIYFSDSSVLVNNMIRDLAKKPKAICRLSMS